jgi:hypothetical protein
VALSSTTDPVTSAAPLDALLGDEPYRLWVEGTAVVQPWDAPARAAADGLARAAEALGLRAFRGPATAASTARTRRWSYRRVTLDAVNAALTTARELPPAAQADLARALYHDGTTPWSDDARASAVGKLRVALHKLSRAGRATKRADGAWVPSGGEP